MARPRTLRSRTSHPPSLACHTGEPFCKEVRPNESSPRARTECHSRPAFHASPEDAWRMLPIEHRVKPLAGSLTEPGIKRPPPGRGQGPRLGEPNLSADYWS